KRAALVYGQPHLLTESHRLAFYDARAGQVLTMRPDGTDQRAVIRKIGYLTPDDYGLYNPTEVLMSPNGEYALVLAPVTREPFLVQLLVTPQQQPLAVSLANAAGNPPGVRVWRLSHTGADFLGWTRDGRPYYAVGNALFVAARAPQRDEEAAPPFDQARIG